MTLTVSFIHVIRVIQIELVPKPVLEPFIVAHTSINNSMSLITCVHEADVLK